MSQSVNFAPFVSHGMTYTVSDSNGQRIFGPPNDWRWGEPPNGSEVFVGRIPPESSGHDIFNLFTQVGPIYQMRLMVHFSTLNRGYAFIKFRSPAVAYEAIEMMNKRSVAPGHELGVVISKDNRELCLRNLPKILLNSSVLIEILKQIHTDPPIKVRLFAHLNMVFLEYKSHSSAMLGRRQLFTQMQHSSIKINWALPAKQKKVNVESNFIH